uniref:Uncharacterized protein n=1 Tax=Anguilla anguilla TaxID=7936 RepID=A0A0E9VNU5_ANGAN
MTWNNELAPDVGMLITLFSGHPNIFPTNQRATR